jgi:hypothetical protein
MILYNLLAKSFVIILTDIFSSDIGLKSETLVGPSILGIRVIYEPLMLCKQTSPVKKAWHKA